MGRPLSHFTTNLKYDRLVQDAKEVLDTLVPKEAQVEAERRPLVQPARSALPHRGQRDRRGGDDVCRHHGDEADWRHQLQAARDYAENIIATIREPLVVLDGELRIVSASRSFYETFQVTPAETEGRLLYEIGQRQWDIPALRQLLEDILPKNTQFEDFRVEHDFPGIGHKVLLLNARRIAGKTSSRSLILLAMEDITQSPAAPKQLKVKP